MHLLQKPCGAVIDACDASGASVAGLDVRSYRALSLQVVEVALHLRAFHQRLPVDRPLTSGVCRRADRRPPAACTSNRPQAVRHTRAKRSLPDCD